MKTTAAGIGCAQPPASSTAVGAFGSIIHTRVWTSIGTIGLMNMIFCRVSPANSTGINTALP